MKKYIEIEGEKVELPDNISSKEEFTDWYKKDKALKKNAFYKSTCGIEINFLSPDWKNKLKKLRSNIERENIEKKYRTWNQSRGRLLAQRNKIFLVYGTLKADYDLNMVGHYQKVDEFSENVTYPDSLDIAKSQIIELFGKFYTVEQVLDILYREFDLRVELKYLQNFRMKYIDKIKELQEEYKRDVGEIRLSYKRSRLEELNDLYFDRKVIYQNTKSKDDYKLLLMTIEQIKREVEGDIITINGSIDINVEMTIQTHIHQEILKGLCIREIILGRVAGRLGVSPSYLNSRLVNSFYKKFNGFSLIDESAEVTYPSQIVYNFDDIKRLNAERDSEQSKLEDLPIQDAEEVGDKSNLRENLLILLKSKKESIEQAKETVEKYPIKKPY